MSIVLLVAIFVVAGLFANVYDDIAADSELSSTANQFPMTGWVMSHLLEMIIAIVFMIMIALFAKTRVG